MMVVSASSCVYDRSYSHSLVLTLRLEYPDPLRTKSYSKAKEDHNRILAIQTNLPILDYTIEAIGA